MHEVRARRSADDFPRSEHLAAKIAEVATDPVAVEPATAEMVLNRIIDNAAVSAASVLRRPVTVARQQALAHRTRQGAKVFGVDGGYSAEWAAWANGVAVRELDAQPDASHDKPIFLRADRSVPYGEMMGVLEILRAGGYSKIKLVALERAPGQPAPADAANP